MKVSRNFDVREFVPPEIWQKYWESSIWFISPKVIDLAQFYRDYFGAAVTINTWAFGGTLTERGYRLPDTETGSFLSQHKMGNAFDCNVAGLSADEVRREILNNEEVFMQAGLTTIEHSDYAPTWVHSDIRTTMMDSILVVKPAH